MERSEYMRLAEHENSYWWFVVKRRLVRYCVQRYGPPTLDVAYLLDIGCGTGANLAQLRQFSPHSIGLDYSPEALKYARSRHGVQLGQGDILHIPLAGNSLDLVTCLDVLYHRWISSDEAALAECYRILKPGGMLILTDSAFSCLSGPHDAVNLAARRYSVPQMREKLVRLGFKIKKQSYVHAWLFPIALIRRWFQQTMSPRSSPRSDVQALPGWLNTLLLLIGSLEITWLKAGNLPLGTSVLFVAQKPGG